MIGPLPPEIAGFLPPAAFPNRCDLLRTTYPATPSGGRAETPQILAADVRCSVQPYDPMQGQLPGELGAMTDTVVCFDFDPALGPNDVVTNIKDEDGNLQQTPRTTTGKATVMTPRRLLVKGVVQDGSLGVVWRAACEEYS